jgi:hypothetical protein
MVSYFGSLLHSLPILDRPWQHISVDFKEMPPDKEGMKKVISKIYRTVSVS